MKKAILLGDANAVYHPLKPVEGEILDILAGAFQVGSTLDPQILCAGRISQYDLVISYTDCWKSKIPDDPLSGLLSFVAAGGGLLVLHNGISLQGRYEFAQLCGAKFTGHPEYQRLEFQAALGDHPITAGLPGFVMEEEPYRFAFDPFTEKTVLYDYSLEDQRWPAAWALTHGLGRVVYLAPGHHAPSFQNGTYREIIRRSGLWAVRGL